MFRWQLSYDEASEEGKEGTGEIKMEIMIRL